LIYIIWKDKKLVSLLSTIHSNTTTNVEINYKEGRKIVSIPEAIEDYNQNMRGVDKFDKLVSIYRFSHSSWKWWRSVFYYLLEVSVINS